MGGECARTGPIIMRASGWADEHGTLCVGRGKKIDEAVMWASKADTGVGRTGPSVR